MDRTQTTGASTACTTKPTDDFEYFGDVAEIEASLFGVGCIICLNKATNQRIEKQPTQRNSAAQWRADGSVGVIVARKIRIGGVWSVLEVNYGYITSNQTLVLQLMSS